MATNTYLVAPNEGLADQLNYLLSAPIVGVPPWLMILWTNEDLTPAQDTVFADLTEANFQGYSRVTLTRSTWTAAVIESDAAVSTYGTAPVEWNCTGDPQSLTGWAIITPVSPVIRYIETFPLPVTAEVGNPVAVLPRVTLTTLPESSLAKERRAARKRGIRIKKR